VTELISPIPIHFIKNSPNPFNPHTSISFELDEQGYTKIEIFNSKGEIIKTLIKSTLSVGSHNFEWDGIDDTGNNSPSGVYFYMINLNKSQHINKMLLLK